MQQEYVVMDELDDKIVVVAVEVVMVDEMDMDDSENSSPDVVVDEL
jgi:hypothetical protein